MSANTPSLHIGVYGSDEKVGQQSRGCSLWAPGYAATITAAGGSAVPLHLRPGCSWDEMLEGVDGVVFAGSKASNGQQQAEEERLCEWCRELGIPLLAVDQGLHVGICDHGLTAPEHRGQPVHQGCRPWRRWR